MNRKIFSAIFLFIFVGLIAFIAILLRRESGFSKAMDIIPEDAAMVIKFNKPVQEISSDIYNSHIWNTLHTIPNTDKLIQNLFFLDTLIRNHETVTELIARSGLKVSLHSLGRQKIESIFYLDTRSKIPKSYLENLISEFEPQVTLEKRKYEGEAIYQINSQKYELTVYLLNNLFIFSRNGLLIENLIRQSKTDSRFGDQILETLIHTEGKNVDANAYIQLSKLPEFISVLSSNQIKQKLVNYNKLSRWGVFDLQISEKELILSGFVDPGHEPNVFNTFLNQQPGRLTIDYLIPSNSQVYTSLVFSDISELFERSNPNKNKNSLNRVFIEKIMPLPEREACVCRVNFKGAQNEELLYAVIRTKSDKMAYSNIREYSLARGTNPQKIESEIVIDEQTSFNVINCQGLDITKNLFGETFSEVSDDFALLYDNHIIFGSSPVSLKLYLTQLIRHQTLKSDIAYSKLQDFVPEKTNFYFNINLFESLDYLNNYLDNNWVKKMKNNAEIFQKIQFAGFSFTSEDTIFYCNLHLNYLDNYEDEPHTTWETLLDTISDFKPLFVENHYTDQNEVFIQDKANNIYLINRVGRVLWKTPIDGQINSEVFQVDRYRNGKLQLLFSTKDKIYLVDRNGNHVENFPVTLRSETHIGLSLFDYDNNKDYRIFVPAADKNIYAYDIEGKLISGWVFNGSEHPLTSTVKHFRVSTKDYLVFSDKYRLYILNRKGETRVDINEAFNFKDRNELYLVKNDDNDQPKICFAESGAQVVEVFFDGRINRTQFPTPASDNFYYEIADLDGNGIFEHLFMDQKGLMVYKNQEVLLFKREHSSTYDPVIYTFSSANKKIGIYDTAKKLIYLYNYDGTLYEGFPLKGASQFTIGRFNISDLRFNLLVNSKSNFLLNYSVK